VYDYTVAAIKSDKLMSEDLRLELIAGVKALEDVPDEKKDWHPGSDGKVLDLVHPSLWPLVYGRTRVLSDRRVPLSDSLAYSGLGDVIPAPDPEHNKSRIPSRRWGRGDDGDVRHERRGHHHGRRGRGIRLLGRRHGLALVRHRRLAVAPLAASGRGRPFAGEPCGQHDVDGVPDG